MENRPLSYDSLKSVLKHMEANKRFEIATRCPSTRTIEKIAPLKINKLVFNSDYWIQVNEKCYKLGVIREYHEGETPISIQRINEGGGLEVDFDEFGFPKESYGYVMTPGDIRIGDDPKANNPIQFDDEERRRRLEAKLKNRREHGHGYDPESRRYRHENDPRIEEARADLLPFFYRDNNMTPPYDSFVQLSTIHFEGNQMIDGTMERVTYNKRLHEVMKYLLSFMFGGRSETIHVKQLKIRGLQTLRLPEGVKFNVHELKTLEIEDDITRLSPILDGSCLPIKHIHVHNLSNRHASLLNGAEEVTFHRRLSQRLMESIQEAPFSKANFTDAPSSRFEILKTIIKNVLKSKKRVGTRYQYTVSDVRKVEEVFEWIEKEMEDQVTKDTNNGFLTLRMTDALELFVSHRPGKSAWHLGDDQQWILKIEIMPKNN